MKDQLPKIQEAIKVAGGEYFQPTAPTPRGPVTIPWRHNGRFPNMVLTFDNHRKKPDRVIFYREGGKRFSFHHDSNPGIVLRGIRRYLEKC